MSTNVETPWGEVGYVVFKRTYARRLKEGDENSPTEEFPDVVERELKGIEKQLKLNLSDKEKEFYRRMRLQLKGSVAGRFMWQLGTRTVKDLGLFSLQNCAFVTVDQPVRPFTWCMDALMLGAGVGYNIQREHVYEVPKPKKVKVERQDTADADFIVPDSREGWVELLKKTLEAHYYTGKSFTYSTICIRSKGSPIKGFGGLASGPEALCWGINEINKILNKRAGKKVRPIDCLDVMNIIGKIVIAGNVRRSAQIAIGDCDDLQFLRAKRWDMGVPNWRAMSNNSVVCNDLSMLPEEFWENYKPGVGEPYGLINLKLAKECGRAGDYNYPDTDVAGVNPCGEQSLANFETCCLSEVYLPNIKSYEEFVEVVKMLYKVNKHSMALKCHHPETYKIVHKNMRMGIGITGYLQATKEQQDWLPYIYEELREYDKKYSKENGFPVSIKLTTVKPSGTLSLLAGVTPGGHSGHSHYHIRRIRMSSDSTLVDLCRKNGYNVEFVKNFDGSEDKDTVVVEFPCKFPERTIVAKDMTAIDQLEVTKRLQREWSDNSVSVTVYYSPEELEDIKEWLKDNYKDNLKTVSFLPHVDHGFSQAPFEEISKEEYEKLVSQVTPIFSIDQIEDGDIQDSFECEGGTCPVK